MDVLRNRTAILLIVTGLTLGANAQTPLAACPGTSHAWQDELRCTKVLKVEAASKFFNADALVRELLKSKEFQELDYQVVRHTGDLARANAAHGPKPTAGQLLLRVTRKRFTSRFTVALVDPTSDRIFVSEESSSFGGTIEPDLAKSVIKWVMEANGRLPAKKASQTKPAKSGG